MRTAAVVGASGYAGLELLRLLAEHPEVEVVSATAQRSAGAPIASLAPGLTDAYGDQMFVAADPARLRDVEIVFLALPHGVSQELVPDLDNPYVVDLAADFRLPPTVHAAWYGQEHRAPDQVGAFVSGLPELFADRLRSATRVAAPGCYPTAAVLALAPLIRSGVVAGDAVTVNALSGVSGRGRALNEGSLFSELNESAHAYGLASHRHTPEIEHLLGELTDDAVTVQFTPHLVPMTRGIVATCTAPLRDPAVDTAALAALADAFYADAPFVRRTSEPAPTKAVAGTNQARVTYRSDPRTGNAIAVCVIDNLVKGTAGQAIQALNLALGLPETTGLESSGRWP